MRGRSPHSLKPSNMSHGGIKSRGLVSVPGHERDMAVAPNLQVRARMLERETASIKPVGGRPIRVVTQSATDSASQGAEPAPSTPEGLGKFMRAEFEAWRKVIKTAKITLQ